MTALEEDHVQRREGEAVKAVGEAAQRDESAAACRWVGELPGYIGK